MKLSYRICLLLIASVALAACGANKDGDNANLDTASDGNTANVATGGETSASTSGPYKVKSGIVESTIDLMGEQQQTIYFDDYGAKQTIVNSMEIMGQKTESISITADGWLITYDPATKEGTKMKVPAGAGAVAGMPDLASLTDDMKSQYKFKELESKTIAGKEATGMSIEAMGMPIKVWTWEGIPLRTEMEMGGKQPMVTEVKSLQVDVPIPADKFQVPADVKIVEPGK